MLGEIWDVYIETREIFEYKDISWNKMLNFNEREKCVLSNKLHEFLVKMYGHKLFIYHVKETTPFQ